MDENMTKKIEELKERCNQLSGWNKRRVELLIDDARKFIEDKKEEIAAKYIKGVEFYLNFKD